METAETTVAVLPDDVLAGILGRLPPHSLAASRCVCTSWRGLVDYRRLLLRQVLPHSVRGLFISCIDYCAPHAHWMARPTTKEEDEGPQIRNMSRSILRKKPLKNLHYVVDHCNGLVLFEDQEGCKYLCNPATRWWVRLPPHSGWGGGDKFLVFDPAAVSPPPPHWEVLLTTPVGRPYKEHDNEQQQVQEEEDGARGLANWPPPTWTCHVISSRTMEWEERVFVREGEPLLLKDWEKLLSCAGAYCHGALYMLHFCRGAYVTRLSLSTNKYRAIKSPTDLPEYQRGVTSFIGRSQQRVYLAVLDHKARLRVWILEEPHGDGTEEWLLKHNSVVNPDYDQMMRYDGGGPWIIDDYCDTQCNEALQEHSVGWDSDNDNIIGMLGDDCDDDKRALVVFLGFHPYREVVFLRAFDERGAVFAYHFNSTKVQYLGNLDEEVHCCDYDYYYCRNGSFVYTPCLIRM